MDPPLQRTARSKQRKKDGLLRRLMHTRHDEKRQGSHKSGDYNDNTPISSDVCWLYNAAAAVVTILKPRWKPTLVH